MMETLANQDSFQESFLLAGLSYMGLASAIRSGNGQAVEDLERVVLLHLMRTKNSKNYKIEVALDLIEMRTLPSFWAELLKNNKVVNLQGEIYFLSFFLSFFLLRKQMSLIIIKKKIKKNQKDNPIAGSRLTSSLST